MSPGPRRLSCPPSGSIMVTGSVGRGTNAMTAPSGRRCTCWASTLQNGGGREDGASMAHTCNCCSASGHAPVQPRGHVNVRESIETRRCTPDKTHGASTVQTIDQNPGTRIRAAHPAQIPAREHSISHGNTRAGSSHGASCSHDISECARGPLQWMWCAPLNVSSAVERRKRRVRADAPRVDLASWNLVDGLYGVQRRRLTCFWPRHDCALL